MVPLLNLTFPSHLVDEGRGSILRALVGLTQVPLCAEHRACGRPWAHGRGINQALSHTLELSSVGWKGLCHWVMGCLHPWSCSRGPFSGLCIADCSILSCFLHRQETVTRTLFWLRLRPRRKTVQLLGSERWGSQQGVCSWAYGWPPQDSQRGWPREQREHHSLGLLLGFV